MGCPAKRVAHGGSGAGLIRTPKLAQEIVRATQHGVRDWQQGATVRDCWEIPPKLAAQVEARHAQLPAAITLHGRTLVQGYTGDADWDAIAAAGEIARAGGSLLLGNGDLRSLADTRRRIDQADVDGALIGRASYGNPFIFQHAGDDAEEGGPWPSQDPTQANYAMLRIAREHAHLYEQSFAPLGRYSFLPMRKHLGWYVRAVPGASHLRRNLLLSSSLVEAVDLIDGYLAYRQHWDN